MELLIRLIQRDNQLNRNRDNVLPLLVCLLMVPFGESDIKYKKVETCDSSNLFAWRRRRDLNP